MKPDDDKLSWFHGKLSRTDAETALMTGNIKYVLRKLEYYIFFIFSAEDHGDGLFLVVCVYFFCTQI